MGKCVSHILGEVAVPLKEGQQAREGVFKCVSIYM